MAITTDLWLGEHRRLLPITLLYSVSELCNTLIIDKTFVSDKIPEITIIESLCLINGHR